MDLRDALISAGAWLDRAGLVPATSGNLSARAPDGGVWISRSGPAKGKLTRDDLLWLGADGSTPSSVRPSAEAALHLLIYAREPDVGCVLHGHGLAAMVLSRMPGIGDGVDLSGWELQKALAGHTTHQAELRLPIVDNDQDVSAMAARVGWAIDAIPVEKRVPGFVIRGHGLYAWGHTVEDALRHVEALETLMRAELALRGVSP